MSVVARGLGGLNLATWGFGSNEPGDENVISGTPVVASAIFAKPAGILTVDIGIPSVKQGQVIYVTRN